MLWEKIKKVRKEIWREKARIPLLFVISSIVALALFGCANRTPETQEAGNEVITANVEESSLDESELADADSIAAVYRDIYDEAVKANTLGSLETMRRIISRLGEKSYSGSVLPGILISAAVFAAVSTVGHMAFFQAVSHKKICESPAG